MSSAFKSTKTIKAYLYWVCHSMYLPEVVLLICACSVCRKSSRILSSLSSAKGQRYTQDLKSTTTKQIVIDLFWGKSQMPGHSTTTRNLLKEIFSRVKERLLWKTSYVMTHRVVKEGAEENQAVKRPLAAHKHIILKFVFFAIPNELYEETKIHGSWCVR